MTTRDDVTNALAVHEADALRAVLEHARVSPGRADDARGLAERLTQALWWSYCTPLGYALDRTSLEDIVTHVNRKLRLDPLPATDAWSALAALRRTLLHLAGPIALEDLDPALRARMMPSWKRTVAFASGAGGSFGAYAAGRGIVALSRTQIGRLLPYLPSVGPVIGGVYRGGRYAAAIGGPAGVALSILAANNALGTNYQRLVPLLLGIGALVTDPVLEAVEV